MTTATISEPKRKRKFEDGEGRPYSELSPEAKERAREWWRECERNDFDVDGMTEMLEEILDYEYGIDDAKISWGFSYCQGDGVSFKTHIDIDKIISHGVPGCEYFSADAQKLAELWKQVQFVEALSFSEYSLDWDFRLDGSDARAEYRTYRDRDEGEEKLCDILAKEMEKVLKSIYEDACKRLEKCGYDELEFRDSDEHIEDTIEINAYEFDEEGEFLG